MFRVSTFLYTLFAATHRGDKISKMCPKNNDNDITVIIRVIHHSPLFWMKRTIRKIQMQRTKKNNFSENSAHFFFFLFFLFFYPHTHLQKKKKKKKRDGMAGTHNKRGKAAAAKKKEQKARAHGGGGGARSGHGGPSHFRHRFGYLSSCTGKKQNAYQSASTNVDPLDAQLFDYLIVVDVEATCQRDAPNFPFEIIEFPAVLLDVRCGRIDRERSFHTYVKPVRHPILSSFCTELTGIRQEQVDHAPTLPEAIQKFKTWFTATIPVGAKAVFASDGPWDFKKFFYENHVLRDGIELPYQFYEYIDIRTSFAKHFNAGVPHKVVQMLHQLDLRFEGREHCGFDDAYNIARIALKLMRDGCVLDFLVCIPLDVVGSDCAPLLPPPGSSSSSSSNSLVQDGAPAAAGGGGGGASRNIIPGYPIYRREEGSGALDRDVVEDIAKNAFGKAYFDFGAQHEREVWEYRKEHSSQFKVHRSVVLQRREKRERWGWWKQWILNLALILVLFFFLFYFFLRKTPKKIAE